MVSTLLSLHLLHFIILPFSTALCVPERLTFTGHCLSVMPSLSHLPVELVLINITLYMSARLLRAF